MESMTVPDRPTVHGAAVPAQRGTPSRLVVVANRLPIEASDEPDGPGWARSPGGLVTALESMLNERDAVWVGWSGRFSDAPGEAKPVPQSLADCELVEVPLSSTDMAQYYDGFCNSTLWPLYHDAVVTPTYHRTQFEAYRRVNERFAAAVAEVAAPGATVWIHDYQLQLVPAMLRQQRPDLTIGFFLHIPFPPVELYFQLPWRGQLLVGMLGADLIGFQTEHNAVNFLALAQRVLGLEATDDWVEVPDGEGRRRVTVGGFPISIDAEEMQDFALRPEVIQRAKELRAELGDPDVLMLGVDRLDYTKGIDVRMKAFVELLEDGLLEPGSAVMVQVATPSREKIEEYQRIRQTVELAVGRAMGAIGTMGTSPIHYLHQGLPREELAAMYIAADIMLVTPLRDGMNLVAKEYVACRTNDDGALVLSEFAGAAIELNHAFLVNPHDADGVKRTIMAAVNASPEEKQRRMTALREQVFTHDVHFWVESFVHALESVRTGPTG